MYCGHYIFILVKEALNLYVKITWDKWEPPSDVGFEIILLETSKNFLSELAVCNLYFTATRFA